MRFKKIKFPRWWESEGETTIETTNYEYDEYDYDPVEVVKRHRIICKELHEKYYAYIFEHKEKPRAFTLNLEDYFYFVRGITLNYNKLPVVSKFLGVEIFPMKDGVILNQKDLPYWTSIND